MHMVQRRVMQKFPCETVLWNHGILDKIESIYVFKERMYQTEMVGNLRKTKESIAVEVLAHPCVQGQKHFA